MANTTQDLKEFQDTLNQAAPFMAGMLNLFKALTTTAQTMQQTSSTETGYKGYKSYDDWYQNSPDSPLWDDPVWPGDE